jgi:predicted ArsR family transcriptional regulator
LLGRCEDRIYEILSDEPVTLGETAWRLGLNCKSARGVFTRLAPRGRDACCKASGRIHVFWRGRG